METEAQLNTNFFLQRVRNLVESYGNMFEEFEYAFGEGNRTDSTIVERTVWCHHVLNVIACEGLARWCRPESTACWILRFNRAGFRVRPFSDSTLGALNRILGRYNVPTTLNFVEGAMQIVFAGAPTMMISAWRVMD